MMPEPSFVTCVARTLYGFEPRSIDSLDQHQFDWRGLYRVQDAQGGTWVMRLVQTPEALDALTHTARLLDWLSSQSYPAPSVRLTTDQQLVGTIDGWVISQTGALSWGPIHGDATLDNVLITDDGHIGIYDFDQSGPGWRAYELQGVFYWAWESERPSFWTSLLEGYTSKLPLTDTDMAAMACFPVL